MICILYLITAAAAFRCAGIGDNSVPRRAKVIQFWTLVGVALFVVGVNKIADLQTYLLEGLKILALEIELREYRQALKMLFLSVVGGMAFLTLVGLGRRVRESTTQPRLLSCGAGCLTGYYMLRAGASMNGHLSLIGPARIWPLEAIGILLILAASVQTFRSMRQQLNVAE